ncbi:MAG: preprotein translocase subunit SecG [Clostridia bacterium]|nr:preprotein translocase subunit SecG [Clostridia bacterium]
MFNVLSLFAITSADIYLYVKIALAAIILICSAFIIFVVMKQSANSDGMEAMSGKSSSDDRDSYYGKNAANSKEGKLKKWTYICAAALALCAIAFLILTAAVK